MSGDRFRIDAQSGIETPVPNELNRFSEISVPVEPGDLIGIFFAGTGVEVPCGAPTPAYDFHFLGADVAPGPAQDWSAGDGLGLQLDLSATLEADTDADGFGDETEDRCPTDAATHGACWSSRVSKRRSAGSRRSRAPAIASTWGTRAAPRRVG